MLDNRRSQSIHSAMIQDLNSLNPSASSPGKASCSPLTASKSIEEFHMGDSGEEVQATQVDATSIAHSSPEKVERKDAAENAVASQRSRVESTSPPGPKTLKASSESPRKPCRSKTLTGPKAPIPRRRSSVPVRRKGQDLISFHRQSCRLFQSLEGTLASNHD